MKRLTNCKFFLVALAMATFAGCTKNTSTYSLLTDASNFKQQAVLVPKKIDILWVIDNSGSMETSQNNLAENFQSFISRFTQSNYDFHMAVTTTDAWEKQFLTNSIKSRIRDGAVLQTNPRIENHSGVFIMDKDTSNLSNIFSTNIKQGTLGNGDERAFESFKQTLIDSWNADFRREDAFLAIIIVSDEEDFSGSTTQFEHSSTNYDVQSYHDYLKTFTNSTDANLNFSVNAIYVDSAACKSDLSSDGFERKISTRLPALADLSFGVKSSICSNFGTSLQLISDSIIQLSSVFKLSREPMPETISITVDGHEIIENTQNGWTYDADNLTITFHGSAVPSADSNIEINFYPKSIKL